MPDLELTRTQANRRTYALEGIGTLRFGGLFARSATAEAGTARWRFARTGFWQRSFGAVDDAGTTVGAFEPRTLRRGGTVEWNGRELQLRPASSWRERYALAEADRELALLDGKSWGRRPVRVTVDDPATLDPGLLLFAAFVVRSLASDADSAAGAAASITAAS